MTATAKEALARKSQASSTITPTQTMQGLLISMKQEISRALPKIIEPERFMRVVLTAFSSNPDLQKCDPISFIAAMMQSAQLGLEPNTPLGEAYLIPYRNNRKGITEVQFQIGYKGLLSLAMRTGEYKSIYAHTVFENDDFDIDYGLFQKLKHKPNLDGDRGQAIGYYAVYQLVNGGYGFYYISKSDAQKYGQRYSKFFNNGPWENNFDEMAKKTAIKQALKYAPKSIEVKKALAIDERTLTATEEDIKAGAIETSWKYIEPEMDEPQEDQNNENQEKVQIKNDFLGDDFIPVDVDKPLS